MVDHVLLNGTTVFDSQLTPRLTMVFYPLKTMVTQVDANFVLFKCPFLLKEWKKNIVPNLAMTS